MAAPSPDWESPPPPPEAPPPGSPSAPDGPLRPGVWLSWLIILVCAVAMIMRDRAAATHEIHQPAPASRPGIDGSDTNPNDALARITQTIVARYAVGLKSVSAVAPRSKPLDLKKIQKGMDDQADSPATRLRAAILAGELLGPGEAADRLTDVLDDPSITPHEHAIARILAKSYNDGPASLTHEEKAQLHAGGWFGELALSRGAPATDPQRLAAIDPALRAFAAYVAVLLLGIALLLAGIALLIVALVLWLTDRLQLRFVPADRFVGARALETVAAWFAVFMVIALATAAIMRHWGYDLRMAAYLLLLLVPLWPLLRGVDWAAWRRAVGWHGGRGVFREAAAGVTGYIAGLPLLAAGAGVTMLLSQWTGERPTHPLVFDILQGGWWHIAAMFVLAAVWAPLLEETIFRGALYQHLRGRTGPLAAGAISGFIFAAIHPQGFAGIPPLMALGFTFAMIREWRGSLIGPMVAHGLNNGTVVAVLLLVLR